MIVVSDTSAISNLLIIGEVGLLRLIFGTVVIPDAVYSELSRIPAHEQALRTMDWIERRRLSDSRLFEKLRRELDAGESEAIALAIEVGADLLLIDESVGRGVAESLGLEVTGILGVLVRAKDAGHIPEVRTLIDTLIEEANFWISQSAIDRTLRLAGEK